VSSAAPLLDGRYQLGPLIGRGGMSDVYRAVDKQTGGQVAVKIVRSNDLPRPPHRRHRRSLPGTTTAGRAKVTGTLARSRPSSDSQVDVRD
jgi:serine/threonine protein kinase